MLDIVFHDIRPDLKLNMIKVIRDKNSDGLWINFRYNIIIGKYYTVSNNSSNSDIDELNHTLREKQYADAMAMHYDLYMNEDGYMNEDDYTAHDYDSDDYYGYA